MLLVACGSTPAAGDTGDLRAVIGANWTRGLVSFLGAFVVLMAVSATPISTLVLGVGGGLVVMAAPWVSSTQTKPVVVVAMLMAALPLAIGTSWSIASPLVALLALTIGNTTIRRNRPTAAPAPTVSPADNTAHPRRSGTNEASTRQVPILPPSSLRITTVAGRGRAVPGPSGHVLTAVGFAVLGADGVFQNVVDSPGCCTLTNIVR